MSGIAGGTQSTKGQTPGRKSLKFAFKTPASRSNASPTSKVSRSVARSSKSPQRSLDIFARDLDPSTIDFSAKYGASGQDDFSRIMFRRDSTTIDIERIRSPKEIEQS